MTAATPLPPVPTQVRPWRKRHPALSRSLLYGLGLGVAVCLALLFGARRDDDERVRREALQQELDALSLVLAADPTGEAVLTKLDERFAAEDLPPVARGRALRWRAMALRRRIVHAAAEGREEARREAVTQAEAALEEAAGLEVPASERTALALEWAEARLERGDVDGGLAVLPAPADLESVPQALLLTLLRAHGLRLRGDLPASLELVRTALAGLEGPLTDGPDAYVGGRAWRAVDVAIELANYLTTIGSPAGARAAWLRLRAAAPREFSVQVAAARGLSAGGHEAEALAAWSAARAMNGGLAASEARRDALLGQLDQRRAAAGS